MKHRSLCLVVILVLTASFWRLTVPSAQAAEINIPCNVDDLINAINTANGNGEADILNLTTGCTYTLTSANNNSDGPNGLPSITSEITINGNGATITRQSASNFRILHVAASGVLTLTALTITNGQVLGDSGSWGHPDGGDAYGGGIYNKGAVTLDNSTVSGNHAIGGWGYSDISYGGLPGGDGGDGLGGGVYNAGTATLTNSTVSGSSAHGGWGGWGGEAIGFLPGPPGGEGGAGLGGGVYNAGTVTLTHSAVSGSSAHGGWGGMGGSGAFGGDGGWGGDGLGGGVYNAGTATLTNSTVSGSTASGGRGGDGGVCWDISVTGCGGDGGDGLGGGVYNAGTATLTNNVISDSHASGGNGGDDGECLYPGCIPGGDGRDGHGRGSGLYVVGSSPCLLHTTVARNGVYVTNSGSNYSAVALTNTILVSHTVGIIVTAGNTATLESTLWNSNTTDWDGDGHIITGTVNVWGAPAFVDPDAGDYHIRLDSAAVDAGVDAGVDYDIDGEPRPQGSGYDMGADETGLVVTKQADPDPVWAGEQLTYTICVTNTSSGDLQASVTDTLPVPVTPSGVLTWTPTITAPGGVWTEQVMITVTTDYSGTLTNVVQVTSEEGATGVYTETSTAAVATPALVVTKQADPDPVRAGEQLTYTICVTNTGNVDLQASVTDTLPVPVTPSGVLTWTPTITAPGGVWTEQLTVTVEMGYVGTLTNVVQVTTEEGATGVYTETSEVQPVPPIYLPVIRKNY